MNSPHSNVVMLLRIWTFPNTLLGLTFGYVSLIFFGSSAQKVDGCWEFHGGLIQWLLNKAPIGGGALAMTLGHCIWGQTKAALDITREHEHVHVRQYEKWGPFFIPAYFTASLIAWSKGGDPYRDNPFEVEAYSKSNYNDET